MKIAVVHGPNLNLLGEREPQHYGTVPLAAIDAGLRRTAAQHGVELDTFQSNTEGALVDYLQSIRHTCQGLLFNPAGYTHTSVALRDAVVATGLPMVEVHLSNPYRRETFRHRSFFSDIAVARIMGFGAEGYRLALEGLIAILFAAKGA